MNAQASETKTYEEKKQAVVDATMDQIRFHLETKARQGEKAREAVAKNANSDWALMDDLAEAYGWAPVNDRLEALLRNIEAGRFDLQGCLTRLNEILLSELLMARTSNSSSMASNLIAVKRLEATQKMYELATGWLIPLNTFQTEQA